jgi:hypothetical protein
MVSISNSSERTDKLQQHAALHFFNEYWPSLDRNIAKLKDLKAK